MKNKIALNISLGLFIYVIIMLLAVINACTKDSDISTNKADTTKKINTLAYIINIEIRVLNNTNNNYELTNATVKVYFNDIISKTLNITTTEQLFINNTVNTCKLVIEKANYKTTIASYTINQLKQLANKTLTFNLEEADNNNTIVFEPTFIETFNVTVSAFIYNTNLNTYELTNCVLLVESENNINYLFNLTNTQNIITLPNLEQNFTFKAQLQGYTYTKTFTLNELKNHANNPLLIIFNNI